MKEKRIVVKPMPLTTILVSGQPRHYFHSEKLGKCRAIFLVDNLPRPTEKSHRQEVDEILDEED